MKTTQGKTKRHCGRFAEPWKIKCKRCGCEVVLTNRQASRRKYCDACQKIVYAELRRKSAVAWWERQKSGVKRLCVRCGVVLESPRRGQKYCDDCRALAKKEKEATRRNMVKELQRTGKPPKEKKPRVSQIVNLNEAARKAGMSYGRYVAMLAMKKGV